MNTRRQPFGSGALPVVLCFLLLSCFSGTALALDIAGPLTIDGSNKATYQNQDIVVTGGVITISVQITFKSLVVKIGGTITHPAGLTGGLQLAITNSATINAGGAISADAKGFPGSTGPGTGGPGAGAVNPVAGQWGGHASYGGEGGIYPYAGSGLVYGDIKAPTQLGSGGGYGYAGTILGGAGGGAVQLSVGGTLTVDGLISANGQYGNGGGSGSGGSILLSVGNLTGVGFPAITANGGQWAGGGRISITYSGTNSMPRKIADGTSHNGFSQIRALGTGDYHSYGGAGTVFVKGPSNVYGDLWVNNNFTDGNGNIAQGTVLPDPAPDPITFDKVFVWGQARLTPAWGGTLNLKVTGDMLVEVTGFVDALGRGFTSGQGPGAGMTNNSSGGGAGGSFGGEGTVGANGSSPTAGPTYGDVKNPINQGYGEHLGSGGGSGYTGTVTGGAGGGAINAAIGGTLTVDGQISANGQYGGDAGAGSGGGIILNVGNLSGIGTVNASGGDANHGGGGGGGRIVVRLTGVNNIDRTRIIALGGYSNYVGYAAAGTVVVKSSSQLDGELRINNNSHSSGTDARTILLAPSTFDLVTIWGQGVLSPAFGSALTLTTRGDLTIELGGYLSGSGRGFGPGFGPGAGANNNATTGYAGGAGGSYGGAGGRGSNGNTPVSGPKYGNSFVPVDFGSGGGRGVTGGNLYPGGFGGSALYLVVNGTLTVNGTLSSTGQDSPGGGGGGGAGGSIYAKVFGALSGNGFVNANGGAGSYGGGGGGGRIALYVRANNFNLPAGNITRAGGGGGSLAAEQGSLYTEAITGVAISSITPISTSLAGGQGVTATVQLTGPAPAGGVNVTLTYNNPLLVSASSPSSVTVNANANSATFNVAANTAGYLGTTSINGFLGGNSAAANLTVKPWFSSLTTTPTSVSGGGTFTNGGTVMLNVPAGTSGQIVTLSSSNTAAVTVPVNVTIAPGATSAPFNFTVTSIAAAASVTITASIGAESKTTVIYVNPALTEIKSFTLSPTSVLGGFGSVGVLTLKAKAPAGGVTVAIASTGVDAAFATVPASVTIPATSTTASFLIGTPWVPAAKIPAIQATLMKSGGTALAAVKLTVRPTGVLTFALIPPTIFASTGDSSVGVITLDSIPTTDIRVDIKSSLAVTTFPTALSDAKGTYIIIPAGTGTAAFLIDVGTVTVQVKPVITATVNAVNKTATLTVNP